MDFLPLDKNLFDQPLIHRLREISSSALMRENTDNVNLALNYSYKNIMRGGVPSESSLEKLHMSTGIANKIKLQPSELITHIIDKSFVRKG